MLWKLNESPASHLVSHKQMFQGAPLLLACSEAFTNNSVHGQIHLEISGWNTKYRLSYSLQYADDVNFQEGDLVPPCPSLFDQRTPLPCTSEEGSIDKSLQSPGFASEPDLFTLSRVAISFHGRWACHQPCRMNTDGTKPNTLVIALASHWFKHGHVMQLWPIKLEGKLSRDFLRGLV